MVEKKARGKYQCTQSARFFPGRISKEREKQLDNFEIDVDDLTYDDVFYCMHQTELRILYFLIDVVRRKWGEDAVKEVVSEWGAKEGAYMYAKFLKTRGKRTKDGKIYGTPELMAMYQDMIHIYYGPTAPYCQASYGDDWTRVVRTQCHQHTGRPEGMASVCKYVGSTGTTTGYMKGYAAIDPAFIGSERTKCMGLGDDHCDRVWHFKKME